MAQRTTGGEEGHLTQHQALVKGISALIKEIPESSQPLPGAGGGVQ